MISILIFLLPFIQIGLTFYLSIQTIAAISVFALTSKFILSNTFLMWAYVLLIASMMMISVFSISGIAGEDIFRRGREALFFGLICLSARGFSGRSPFKITSRSHLPIVAVAGGLAALAAVQYVSLHGRAYFGLPKTLYITNADTLPDLINLRYGIMRPFGTFGEPSYFSFVLLSLFVMLSPLAASRLRKPAAGGKDEDPSPHWLRPASRLATLGCFAVALAGVLSQSLSFYLAFPILLYVCIVRLSSSRVQVAFAACAGAIVAVLLASSVTNTVLGRVSASTTDASIDARIVKPLQIIPQFLAQYPFGAASTKWIEAISPISSQYGVPARAVSANALFNSFFNYGFIGFACLFLVIGSPKSTSMRVYIALSFTFNGSIYSMDKYFVIALTMAIYASYQYLFDGLDSDIRRSRRAFSGAPTRLAGAAA